MYLNRTSPFNEKPHRSSRRKKSASKGKHAVAQVERAWELHFAPDHTGQIGMVWTSGGFRLMARNPKDPKEGVSSWRLRQLRELGIKLHKEDTLQFHALMAEIASRKAAGAWEPEKYEGTAA
jgi:hypothetical protein